MAKAKARTPLAKPHAVAVAVCGNKKIPARQTDRKTVAAQPQRLPQLYPCHALAAYFNAAHIAGVIPLGFTEPAAGITAGRNAQLGRKCIGHLLRGELHTLGKALGVFVQRAVHPLQIGQGLLPHILACRGPAFG